MNKTWNHMTLGERIITSAWIATREHLLAEKSERGQMPVAGGRIGRLDWSNRWANSPFDSEDQDESPDGHVREGAD